MSACCATADSPKRVLILNSFGREVAPFNAATSAFRNTLARDFGQTVDIYEAPLDLARFATPGLEAHFVDFIEHGFPVGRADLVVPIGSPAVRFVTQYREKLFRETPVVFTGVDPRLLPSDALRTNATLVTEKVDLPGMIQDMLQIQPDTTNIVVVFGASPLEKFWVGECRREWQAFTNRVGFSWLDTLSLHQITERVRKLPPRSFIYFGMLVMDAEQVPHDHDDGLKAIHAAANAPIFGPFGSQFGSGTIGGRLYQERQVGAQAAKVAIRILRGERPGDIPPEVMGSGQPVYDWRELRRWGVRIELLPPGSIVQFREPTPWARYKWHIIAIISVCFVEALLVFTLLANLIKRRRAERSLVESEARFRNAADGAPVMIWMAGLDRLCTFFNKPWLDFTGRTLEQELGNGWAEGVHPDDLQNCLKTYVEAFVARQPFVMEFRHRRHDGEYRWLSDTGKPRQDNQGNFAGYVGSCVDITDRRKAELEAQQRRQELAHFSRVSLMGELSTSMAHELNQPLTAILTNAQAAQRFMAAGKLPEDELREILKDIACDTTRARDVIHHLRALIKKSQQDFTQLDLAETIRGVAAFLHGDIVTRNTRVELELAKHLPPVHGDHIQLQQVLINLIVNALDAMNDLPVSERCVTITTTPEPPNRIRVTVRDRGTGIPPDQLDKLFQPFYTTKAEGMGIGLSVTRSIVESHGGRIWAENHTGGGAVFHITLPVAEGV